MVSEYEQLDILSPRQTLPIRCYHQSEPVVQLSCLARRILSCVGRSFGTASHSHHTSSFAIGRSDIQSWSVDELAAVEVDGRTFASW